MRLVLPLISVLPLVLASPIDASGDALSDTTTAIITTPNNDNRNTIMPGWHVGADPATEDCGAELIGYGPIPDVDTILGWTNYAAFNITAAAAATPSGYSVLAGVGSTNGTATSVLLDPKYWMGWNAQKQKLASYDPSACAALCTASSSCAAFNVFFQRSPTTTPSYNPISPCYSPSSTTIIFCSMWTTTVNASALLNGNPGQVRGGFQVLIAGSRVWNK